MATDGLSIEMLPARHGDALWIEWGDAEDRHRMLIDGGPKATYRDLRMRFEDLDRADRHVDLFIVTHIDADHIDGAIKLLADEDLGVTYSDIWFNEHRHLVDQTVETRATRGAMQGEFFGAVVEHHGLPLNDAFGGAAVVVPPEGPLPSVELAGGLRLVLLSPTPPKLERLRRNWEKVLEEKEMEPGDRAEALARMRGPTTRGGDATSFGGDTSPANGSSIAVIAELGDERWLLAGDAHDDVLLEGLHRYSDERRVRLDGFKVPHHGSINNITPELLDAIDCRRFLVSTNGAYFDHPDEPCVDLIVERVERPQLIFNYRTEHNEKWAAPSGAYTAVFGDGPNGAALGDGESNSDRLDRGGQSEVADRDEEPDGAREVSANDTVAVTVYHGSLERSDDAVLVGHYLGTPLSGAEGFVDRRFGGRLTDRVVRGGYPGDIGESLLVRGSRRRHPRAGVLVVGLGEYGELTPLRLMTTVQRALIDHALDEADRRDEDRTVELGISSVLLGATGDQGLSVSASVRALVRAIREANRELRDPAGPARARFSTLSLWERGGAEAELAFRAVHSLYDDDEQLDDIVATPDLKEAVGALRNRLVLDTEETPWWRLRVTSEVDERDQGGERRYLELRYSVSGRLARAEDIEHEVEVGRLQRLLGDSVSDPDPGSKLHAALFELLFPNELKRRMTAAQDLLIEVDDTTADLPWEMLAAENPGAGRAPLALRAQMMRQLRLPNVPPIRRAPSATALVIGNPPAGNLGTLPGALVEARRVAEVLDDGGYSVEKLLFETNERASDEIAKRIETTLLTDPYRILHIAAHGLFDANDPTRSGVVIGSDDFLTASFFRSVRYTPDLVFLNCCHLANIAMDLGGDVDLTSRNFHRLGASLARQLIGAGVKSVVVAGWAVDDAAAETFAAVLYEKMLGGDKFGHAVHAARAAARRAAADHSTWGAYQCYGDGEHRLPRVVANAAANVSTPQPITVAEARRRIESMVVSIESVGIEADHDRAEAELLDIERAAEERGWFARDDGRLCEDLATAWAAIGEYRRAIDRLDQALTSPGGGATLRGLERRANFRGRYAAELLRADDVTDADRATAQDEMDQAFASLDLLERVSESGERSALRAGHHKRLAAAATGNQRSHHLHQAAEGYRKAYEEDPSPYGMLNYVQLEEIRARLDKNDSQVTHLYEEVDEMVEMDDEASTGDYWTAVRAADSALTQAIVRDEVPAQVEVLVDLYEAAFESGSTAKGRQSSLDHLVDLAGLHPDDEQSAAIDTVHRRLTSAPSGA